MLPEGHECCRQRGHLAPKPKAGAAWCVTGRAGRLSGSCGARTEGLVAQVLEGGWALLGGKGEPSQGFPHTSNMVCHTFEKGYFTCSFENKARVEMEKPVERLLQ